MPIMMKCPICHEMMEHKALLDHVFFKQVHQNPDDMRKILEYLNMSGEQQDVPSL